LNHQKYDKDDDNFGKINIFPDFEWDFKQALIEHLIVNSNFFLL
jgi:hypothetical protein